MNIHFAGIHLLPGGGEFSYDTIAYQVTPSGGAATPLNTFGGGGATTDYSTAIGELQTAHPECTTVALVCAWFCDGLTAGTNFVFPATNYANGAFAKTAGGADHWRASSLTETSSGLRSIPVIAGSPAYPGTPSDQSIVRCIVDLKSRGLKVIFYPVLLMTSTGLPSRSRITYSPDVSSAATTAALNFLGAAATSNFTPDATNLTVAYSGALLDFSYRRMILHYAFLCTVANGVDMFMIGSGLSGLETIRGPAWTKPGTLDGSGFAIWDYPFVAGLVSLAADVRSVFDGLGYIKNRTTLKNLIGYAAESAQWMGFQHPGQNGQWPHLDQLWASSNIDIVGINNRMPLSDWTTGVGLDSANWTVPAPSGTWPPGSPAMNGLGLTGSPTLYSLPYLEANIEGGEGFNWFYTSAVNAGAGFDPGGSALTVSLPAGDRLSQARNAYAAGQELLAFKRLRWWWNNAHKAVYDTGSGWAPQGARTEWTPNSKSIAFLEYGFPAVDKASNQPGALYDPISTESLTPYWSIWDPVAGASFRPRRDDTVSGMALEAIYEYWTGPANTSVAGVPMVQMTLSCALAWDARPFPTFPVLSAPWTDSPLWPSGLWLNGRSVPLPPIAPSPDPIGGVSPLFPALATLGWSVHVKPNFSTDIGAHVAGRRTRRPAYLYPLFDVELTYELLRSDAVNAEFQTLVGFFAAMAGQAGSFWITLPGLSTIAGQVIGTGDGTTMTFPFTRSLGAATIPVDGLASVTQFYLNGVALAGVATVNTAYPPSVTFATAPGAGVVISADFSQYWLARFADDVADFNEFMSTLWELASLKLKTLRPPPGATPPGPNPWTPPPPLDGIPGITAAFSLRKLSTTYAGAAVRVNITGGVGQADIGFTAAGDFNWAALTALAGGNTANIVTWYDQSGNGNNVYAAGGSYGDSPALVISGAPAATTGTALRPALLMNSTYSNYLTSLSGGGGTLGTTTGSIFAVANAASGGAGTSGEPSWYLTPSLAGGASTDPNGGAFQLSFVQGGSAFSPPSFVPTRFTGSIIGTWTDMDTPVAYTYGHDAHFMFRYNTSDATVTKGYVGGGTPSTNASTTANSAVVEIFVGVGISNARFKGAMTELILSNIEQTLTNANKIGVNQASYYGVLFANISV